MDSQSVKNTDTAEQKGYDAGKKVSRNQASPRGGHARIAPCIQVTTADVTDRAGALAMFGRNRSDLNRVQKCWWTVVTPGSPLLLQCKAY